MTSFCDVSLGDYDGDEPAFYWEREVTARKLYACLECRDEIVKGARHHLVTGKWDDEIRTYRFCSSCWEILSALSKEGELTFGVLWEAFAAAWDQGATLQGCLYRLSSVQGKADMTIQWRKWKKLPDFRA